MARKIAAYSWKHRNAAWMAECRKDRKKLGLGRICSNLTFSERQKEIKARQEAGALYANAERKAKTAEKITGAVSAIQARGEEVTITGVAKEAGLSRLTVRRHKTVIGEGW
jgi:DNA invertase Pin-like site-specific DNA recombinase